MNALACIHFEPSTVTFRPLGVALKMALSLKAIAFNIFDRFRALSRLAANTFSSSGGDCVDRGIVVLKTQRFIRNIHQEMQKLKSLTCCTAKTYLVKQVFAVKVNV